MQLLQQVVIEHPHHGVTIILIVCVQLLQQVVIEHPHHGVGIILSLANANLDVDLVKQRTKKSDSARLSRSLREEGDIEEVSVVNFNSLFFILNTRSLQ